MRDNVTVHDQSSLHRYRTEIPNIIMDMGLDTYELSLYLHLKRIAGDNGKCWMSIKSLSAISKISVRKIQYLKSQLVIKKLISIKIREKKDGSLETDLIEIVDIWPKNFEFFKEKGITPESRGGGAPHAPGVVHHMHQGGAPHAPKEEHKEEEPIINTNYVQTSPKNVHNSTKLIETPPPQRRAASIADACKQYKLIFQFDTFKFSGILEEDFQVWSKIYPMLDIKLEILKMEDWLKTNPSRAKRKRDWRRFITNWLKLGNETACSRKRINPANSSLKESFKEDPKENVTILRLLNDRLKLGLLMQDLSLPEQSRQKAKANIEKIDLLFKQNGWEIKNPENSEKLSRPEILNVED